MNTKHQLQNILDSIDRQPQQHLSTLEQAKILRQFATRLGLYGAADLLNNILDREPPA